jgi:hypothetical protein
VCIDIIITALDNNNEAVDYYMCRLFNQKVLANKEQVSKMSTYFVVTIVNMCKQKNSPKTLA